MWWMGRAVWIIPVAAEDNEDGEYTGILYIHLGA